MAEGIRVRHSRSCPIDNEGRGCNCSPSYEASVCAQTRARQGQEDILADE